jgi:hypothetical protein
MTDNIDDNQLEKMKDELASQVYSVEIIRQDLNIIRYNITED